MKKFYSLLSIISIGALTVFGQVSTSPVHKSKVQQSSSSIHQLPKITQSNPSARFGNPQNQTAAIIWSDDFSVPANWVISNDVGNTDDWIIGLTPPSGVYFINPIASTSAANGFALYDSDLMCSGNQIGNLTTANAINCTGHPQVRVRFEEYYRRYIDSTYMYVSTDNVNWTLFEVNAPLAVNAFVAANPTSVSIDISSVAGNQATVYLRFTFYSPSTLGNGAGCAYSWMIDDVIVEDIPADDVAMVPAITGEYTATPLTQAQAINLEGRVVNPGLNVETNVGFDVFVLQYDYNIGDYVLLTNSTSNAQATLNPGDTTSILSAGTFVPTDTGVYAFAYLSHMDNTDLDSLNDFSSSLAVISDTIYARDNGYIYGGDPDQYISWTAGGNGSFAMQFEAVTDVTITSVSTIFAAHAIGDQLTASIYSITGGLPDVQLGLSATLTATDLDTGGVFMSFAIDPPVTMGPGLFAVSIDQLTTDPIHFWMYDNVYTPGTTFFGSPGAWALLDTVSASGSAIFPRPVMVIRPNLDMSVGVNSIKSMSQVEVYPNPSQGKLYVMNSGSKADMTIEVINNVGQIVYTNKFNQMSNAVVDLSNQPSGVYTVKVKSDKEITTKSVVLTTK